MWKELGVAMAIYTTSGAAWGAPIEPQSAGFRFDFFVDAFDGFTHAYEGGIEQSMTVPAAGVVTSTVEVTGTQGTLHPMTTLGGSLGIDLPESTWTLPGGSLASHHAFSITFTDLMAQVGPLDPIALVDPTSNPEPLGAGFTMLAGPGTMHLAGVWHWGAAEIPFDENVDDWAFTTGINKGAGEMSLRIGSQQQYVALIPLLTLQEGPITYSGRLGLTMVAYVPEPDTAALLALGLLVIGLASRPRAASTRGAASPPA